MNRPVKWFTPSEKLPMNCARLPFVFVVGDQEIEGWRLFCWDKKIHQFAQEKVGGGTSYIKMKMSYGGDTTVQIKPLLNK